ncbi:related to transcription factor medusa [Melanopsichium pennsylvanicum]|uniref:Related to transcription factor medusa n=2 Tax=Melanopsichium pennsylvanicum TaxID=63383 RepID=A0AAJ5C6Q1_9BASI|nr:related to transcription factor medusa [Melanopsichium pennsylvanicum 4]SNX86087.1 related to transcription factor medusa [Melanopsichium pennsylvanicum]
MSGAASTNPALSFGPAGPSSLASSNFQSPDPSSSSAGYTAVGGFPAGFGRVKPDASAYSYDEQAPRSQQHGNYTHQDLGSTGSLAQTQALGGFYPSTSQHYADPMRSSTGGQGHYVSGHARHQSLNSGVSQLGLGGGGGGAYSLGDVNSNQYNNYNLVPAQRSPPGRSSGLASETSPTRSRFPSAGYNDPRTLNRPPSRSVGLGVSLNPGPSSDDSVPKMDGGSPRSLKRSADPLEDLRSSSDHAQLRRPASFPVLGTGVGNMYGRPMGQDARSAQTVGRRTGRGGMAIPGQITPGRSHATLPGLGGGFYDSDGRRESLGSNATMQSPVTYHGGSGSSDELGLGSGGLPQLMRATQIPGSIAPAPAMAPHDPMYSPPGGSGGGTPRAKLELHGNLNDMAVGWSHDEWRSGRRLVQFWRRQEGTTIHATFRPILPSQYVPNSIVISCIFREDKNECFVTSVDTIYLLEALVASRFTVEEKNRIRRNLEGFRPITVSKNKRECERFFKLIMSFPNPKPRNIEKDVKVFPWKVLASALCKIIGKYSASYEGGPPVLADLAPEAPFGGAMGASSLPSVDLSGGHYRDTSYPGASPSVKDTRLADSSFDYDRQGGPGGMYGVADQSMHHSAPYGGSTWNVGNQGMTFGGQSAPGGYAATGTGNAPFPSSGGHSHTHSASSYDSFAAGNLTHGQPASEGSNIYGHQPQEGYTASAPPLHSQGQNTSTLAAAAGDYYADRR